MLSQVVSKDFDDGTLGSLHLRSFPNLNFLASGCDYLAWLSTQECIPPDLFPSLDGL
jgi:hypothetical protein